MASRICKVCYYYNQNDQLRLQQLCGFPPEMLGCFDPSNHSASGLQPRPELVVTKNGYGFIEPMKCFRGSSCPFQELCPFAHDNDLHFKYAAPLNVPGRTSLPTMPTAFANTHLISLPLSSASCEEFSKRVQTELKLDLIQQDLTRDNYKEKMNNLICWEERNHILTLGSKCNGNYDLVVYQSGRQPSWIKPRNRGRYPSHFGYLQGISPDQIAYASQASEAVYIVDIVNAHRKMEVRADILGVNFNHTDDKMYIAFQREGFQTLCHMFPQLTHGHHDIVVVPVTVEFEVNHRYFNNLIKGVNGISQDVVNKLMPLEGDFVQPAHPEDFPLWTLHHLQKLDREGQLAAIKSITCLKNDAPVVLLRGSFGTGKTRVLALAAYLFTELGKMKGQTARVLICAHHHHSADHLVNSYFGPMISDRNSPWRNVILVRLKNRDHGSPKYNQYYMTFDQLCEFAASHDLKNSSLVVVSTFLTSLNFRGSKVFPRGFFTHVLIDEGGQAREPETLAPLCLATKNTKIVIAGDPCQVGPAILVLGDEARENGLKTSLMDRLRIMYHKYGRVAQSYVVTLLKNYRCHTSILAVPNQLFYRSQLIPPNTDLQDEVSGYPLVFVCSSLESTQPRPEFEARILLNQVSHWLRQVRRLSIRDISIVTTTRTQLVTTRNLAKRDSGLNNVKMLTTYTIQGEEFQAVFWSTTEPLTADGNTWNPTISPCDRYVFNTVLTRAHSLVVVVGSPLVLLQTEKHMVELYGEQGKCWSLYIQKCIEHNTLVIPGLVEKRKEVKNEFTRRLKRIVDSQWIEPQSSVSLPSVQAQSNPVNVTPAQPRPVTVTPEPRPVTVTPAQPRPVTVTPAQPRPVTVTPAQPNPVTVTPAQPNPVTVTPAQPRPVTVTPAQPRPVTVTPAQPRPVTVTPAQSNPVTVTPAQPRPVTVTPAQPRPVTVTPAQSNPVTVTPAQPNPVTVTPAQPRPVTVTPAQSNPVTVTPAQPNPVTVTPAQPNPVTVTPAQPNPVTVTQVGESPSTDNTRRAKIAVPGKRKVWGTLKICLPSTVKNAIMNLTTGISESDITIKRKYQVNSDSQIKKWWYVLTSNEPTMVQLENEWEKIKVQTSWNLTQCLSYVPENDSPETTNEGETETETVEGSSHSVHI